MGYGGVIKCLKCGMTANHIVEDGGISVSCPICGYQIARRSMAWENKPREEDYDPDGCNRVEYGGFGMYMVREDGCVTLHSKKSFDDSADDADLNYETILTPGAQAVFDVSDFGNIKSCLKLRINLDRNNFLLDNMYDLCEDANGDMWLVAKYIATSIPVRENILYQDPVFKKAEELLKKQYGKAWDDFDLHMQRYEIRYKVEELKRSRDYRLDYQNYPTSVMIRLDRDGVPMPDSIKGRFYDPRYAKMKIEIEYLSETTFDSRDAEFAQVTIDDLITVFDKGSYSEPYYPDLDPKEMWEGDKEINRTPARHYVPVVDQTCIVPFSEESKQADAVFEQMTIDELLLAGDEVE